MHLDSHITPIKEGEKIKVKLNVGKKKHEDADGSSSDHAHNSSGASKGFFKPPPAPGSTVFTSVPAPVSQTTEVSTTEDEDWGDFM